MTIDVFVSFVYVADSKFQGDSILCIVFLLPSFNSNRKYFVPTSWIMETSIMLSMTRQVMKRLLNIILLVLYSSEIFSKNLDWIKLILKFLFLSSVKLILLPICALSTSVARNTMLLSFDMAETQQKESIEIVGLGLKCTLKHRHYTILGLNADGSWGVDDFKHGP